MANAFMGYDHFVPLLAPVDIVGTTNTGLYVDLMNAQAVSFLIQFGAITSTTATDEIVITFDCATAEDGTEATVEYKYQLSAAVGTPTWGDVTTVAATGLGMGADDSDSMFVLCTLDPGILAASDYRYARCILTVSGGMEACLVSVMAILETRYKQDDHISATASASS